MQKIKRERYIEQLIARRENGSIKVITGIRRCGKSYLLSVLYRDYLIEDGVSPEDIIMLSLDDAANARHRNPLELDGFIRERTADRSRYFYIFIDEVQMAGEVGNPYLPGDRITFVNVLLSLMKIPNADIYVTGSNSRMLSSDVVTEFRDKGDEIRMMPLSFSEYLSAIPDKDRNEALSMYIRYGGLPRILQFSSVDDKGRYLKELFEKTYMKDVVEKHRIGNDKAVLDDILDVEVSHRIVTQLLLIDLAHLIPIVRGMEDLQKVLHIDLRRSSCGVAKKLEHLFATLGGLNQFHTNSSFLSLIHPKLVGFFFALSTSTGWLND